MRSATAVLALVLLVASPAVLTAGAADRDPLQAMSALRVAPPAAAPDVAFQTLDGRPARLDAFRGQPIVLTFFTTW